MGILEFFKKKKTNEINIEQIDYWINIFLSEKGLKEELAFSERDVNSKKTRLREYLQELQELKIERLNEKGQAYLEGNRKAYTEEINKLLSKITIPKNLIEAKEKLNEISEQIEEFDKRTKRNFYILKEFDQNLMKKISGKLYDLDKIISKLIEKLGSEELERVENISKLKNKYYQEREEIKKLEAEIEEIQKERLAYYERKGKEADKIKEIKKNPKYEELKKQEEKKNEIIGEREKEENKIKNFVNVVKPALKKEMKKGKGLVKECIENPVEYMKKKDVNKVLRTIKEEVENYSKKKESMKKKLEEYNEEKIKKIIKKIQEKESEQKEIDKRINNNITHLNVKEYEGRMKSLDESIELENKKIIDLKNKIDRINPKLTKQKIRDEIKKVDENTRLII